MINHDEKITVSKVGSPTITKPYSRESFYEEAFRGKNANLAVHVINVLLFDSNGDLILQKRSPQKNHNPGLVDKSIGGHITFGDSPDYTVMVESVQELLTPAIVLRDKNDFTKTLKLLRTYTDTISIMQHLDVREVRQLKLHDGKLKPVNNVINMYFGIYTGRMRPADKESTGILYYTDDQLNKEISEHPNLFTDDLAQIYRNYHRDIADFRKLIKDIV